MTYTNKVINVQPILPNVMSSSFRFQNVTTLAETVEVAVFDALLLKIYSYYEYLFNI